MLSSWARMKFPHVFQAAVASSAPILLFEETNTDFFRVPTETYRSYDQNCPDLIRKAFKTLFDQRNSTIVNKEIIKELNNIFKPCHPLTNNTHIKLLEDSLTDALMSMAQLNYPYQTQNIFDPDYVLPGEPVKVACEKIRNISLEEGLSKLPLSIQSAIGFGYNKYNQIDPITKFHFKLLKEAANVFYNTTGNQKCLEIGNGNSNEEEAFNGWWFMACSEMIMPMEANGITDMFNPSPWNLTEFSNTCKKIFKTDVRPDFVFNFFGGRKFEEEIKNYKNIIFINGKMDPWYAGCPKMSHNTNPDVIITEAESAHHLDLRLPNDLDPPSINAARELTKVLIKKWTQTQ